MNNSEASTITLYKFKERAITAIQGKSEIVYPFYSSSGVNSQYKDTYFPWMGYMGFNKKDHSLVMTKPVRADSADSVDNYLSPKIQQVIRKHLGDSPTTDSFIRRMGNDEALAISCSFNTGIWKENPNLYQEIFPLISSYHLTLDNIQVQDIKIDASKDQRFIDINHQLEFVNADDADMGRMLEKLTLKEMDKYEVNAFNLRKNQKFPSLEDLDIALSERNEARSRQRRPGIYNLSFNLEALDSKDSDKNKEEAVQRPRSNAMMVEYKNLYLNKKESHDKNENSPDQAKESHIDKGPGQST